MSTLQQYEHGDVTLYVTLLAKQGQVMGFEETVTRLFVHQQDLGIQPSTSLNAANAPHAAHVAPTATYLSCVKHHPAHLWHFPKLVA